MPQSGDSGASQRAPQAGPRDRSRIRSELGRAAEVTALSGLVFAQPVLGPLGETPETFVALEASSGQILAFGLLVALVPPLVLATAGAATRLGGERLRRWVHLAMLGVLAGAGAVMLAREAGAGGGLRLAVGLGVAAALVAAYTAWVPTRTFLRFASPAPAVILGAFLFVSPVSSLVELGGASPSEATGTGGASEGAPPVVMLVFDELPTRSLLDGKGGIDAEMFPNFARLADTSTWYRDATTLAPSTPVAMGALLTGTVGEEHHNWGLLPGHDETNVFTLLAESHELYVREWITNFCPDDVCGPLPPAGPMPAEAEPLITGASGEDRGTLALLLDEAVDLWWSSIWPSQEERTADLVVPGTDDVAQLVDPAISFLSAMEVPEGDRPPFYYFHSPVPHQPWMLTASGDHYRGPRPVWGVDIDLLTDDEPDPRWYGGPGSEGVVGADRVRHLAQLQWTDLLLGAFMDRLEELEIWDEALVVVTSDHGFGFQPGEPLRLLTPENQTDIAWVPLLVKEPHQSTGRLSDDNVLLVDVLPTLAEAIGVEVPWATDGHPMGGGPVRGDEKPILVQEPERFAGRGPGDVVYLDRDLEDLLSSPAAGSGSGPLRPWRHGAHGDLVGVPVTDLGVCAEAGVENSLEPDSAWLEDMSVANSPAEGGDGFRRLWLSATISGDEPRDVAVAVDGVVAGWTTSRMFGEANAFGLLLAPEVAVGAEESVEVFAIADGDQECDLIAIDAEMR